MPAPAGGRGAELSERLYELFRPAGRNLRADAPTAPNDGPRRPPPRREGVLQRFNLLYYTGLPCHDNLPPEERPL